ncbi:MAG: ribulose-phosphate 3-epimerase [Lachnospiraceae bacterium]|nr:ribulose-phosphate 3-epimerase [Lachnospiraceae bacterium]
MNQAQIAPSILAADFGNMRGEVQSVAAGGCELLHLDIMDGHFVPNITMGPAMIRMLRSAVDIDFDIHLMIENPELYLSEFYEAAKGKGTTNILTVHWETCPHIHRTIEKIHSLGDDVLAGCAINPGTPVNVLEAVLEELDMVLLMSVDPGFGGQAMIPSVSRKIAELRRMAARLGKQILIEVDGGVKLANMMQVAEADILVMGSAIFNAAGAKDNMQQAKRQFKQLKGLL